MAKIETVDYAKMPKDASAISNLGVQLNSEMTTAYTNVTDMHADWYGVRYNALVDTFNNMIPNVNEILKLVVEEIPTALDTAANNYAKADTGSSISGGINNSAKLINNVPKSNDVGMRFITSSVVNTKNVISANFEKSVSLLDDIQSAYAQITWQSEAADAFANRFKSLKDKMISNINETNTMFKNLMDQTEQDIQSTETANTVE